MMTIEEMRQRKRILGYSYVTLSERAGVPLGTVQKVLGGYSQSPREKTLRKLEEALSMDSYNDRYSTESRERVADSAYVYGSGAAQDGHEWTVEECRALPEDQRVELIGGVVYNQAAPLRIHQELLMELALAIRQHIQREGKDCKVYPAPFFVRLEKDNHTFVEPDISVICDRSLLSEEGCEGAPDWIIEITSPSTKQRDYGIKLFRYRSAGVKLYWIVDPEDQRVLVYDFTHEDDVHIFRFEDQVPVSLCEDFVIDFSSFDLR